MPGIRPRLLPLLLLAAATVAQGQTTVTTPRQQFGHVIGADYVLPNYTQFSAYWEKLARESERMVLDTIGRTAEGRPQLMAIITSPANHTRLERYREIARRLALAEGTDEATARQLAAEGRAVVWIDGGLHATEVLGAQQLLETVYQLVSRDDEEVRRILDNVIVLAVHANPDGMELVSNWYMREPDSLKRSTGGVPRLYQKYVGHDNNRDSYASTQVETENMNRVMYREWFPQVMYNHHQTGPAGTVMFAPPFRDPFNYNFDPLIPVGIDLVAAAMHNRFIAENKPGATMRTGSSYSTWWNGGVRTTAYFHNMIGLLTETIGNPTPITIPFVLSRQLPKADLPDPIEPQPWHFRQSVDYSVSANFAVMDIAARYRDQFLFNIWRMGMNSIERGSRDSWTVHPRTIAAAQAVLTANRPPVSADEGFRGAGTAAAGTRQDFERLLRDPAARDARGYILPAEQPDFLTAAKFIDALLEVGITVHRATRAFEVSGKSYPAGSYVVKAAQAFRPHVLDMFEPQDHPDDIPYPGAAPTPPYDNAGYTLALQMGFQFDRILDDFDGPFE
ncbi:MAG: peptidase, partial [Gemmatimonadetes bacterium]|nr:peptidase [Gemmatimonadota bacterium]